MTSETVEYESDWYKHTARIVIDNPEEYNSYRLETLRGMIEGFEEAMWDDSVQFIILTGRGEDSFCTGGNVNEYAEEYNQKPNDFWKWGEVYGRVFHFIRHCGKPVIASVNGAVAGGGFEFIAACDLAISADNATFISPGPRVGMTSVGGLSQWLPLHTSIKKAAAVVMLSQELTAEEALEMGVVNDVVSQEDLEDKVHEYIDRMIDLSPSSLHYFKIHLNFWKDLVWDLTWEQGREWFSRHIGSIEPSEGLWAFKEKRKADNAGLRKELAKGMDPNYPHGPYHSRCESCDEKFLPAKSEYCLNCGASLNE